MCTVDVCTLQCYVDVQSGFAALGCYINVHVNTVHYSLRSHRYIYTIVLGHMDTVHYSLRSHRYIYTIS